MTVKGVGCRRDPNWGEVLARKLETSLVNYARGKVCTQYCVHDSVRTLVVVELGDRVLVGGSLTSRFSLYVR